MGINIQVIDRIPQIATRDGDKNTPHLFRKCLYLQVARFRNVILSSDGICNLLGAAILDSKKTTMVHFTNYGDGISEDMERLEWKYFACGKLNKTQRQIFSNPRRLVLVRQKLKKDQVLKGL